mgnify:CR=1 FL=1
MRCKPSNFNPRSYKRSDCCFHKFFVSHKYFNPRSYKRSDLGRRFSVVVYKTYFNPRSYKRSDGSRDTTRKLFQNFNPRSYKRSDSPISLRQWTDWNFNPRSYKRSDQSEAKPYEINKISIHAPTRGATEEVAKDFSKPMISIHAPTRGATTLCSQMSSSSSWFQSTLLQEERRSRSEAWGHVPKFQSTLLQEERHNTDDACTDGLHISIHAPTRGATMIIWIKSAAIHISIHAPTRGATGLKIPASHVYKFQSTLLQEERQLWPKKETTLNHNFNPRSYKRSDTFDTQKIDVDFKFQSTLLQEERLYLSAFLGVNPKFQSTLLQEERPKACLGILRRAKFQSTLLQEERLKGE